MSASLGTEVQLLDPRGCLTPEALCFVDELLAEQQAVVERHVQSCFSCAQQQMTFARVVRRVREGKPRVAIPVEAQVVARQAVMRGLLHQEGSTTRSRRRKSRPSASRRSPGWEPAVWGATLVALSVLLGLLLARFVF